MLAILVLQVVVRVVLAVAVLAVISLEAHSLEVLVRQIQVLALVVEDQQRLQEALVVLE